MDTDLKPARLYTNKTEHATPYTHKHTPRTHTLYKISLYVVQAKPITVMTATIVSTENSC